jgi:hypothetical protein
LPNDCSVLAGDVSSAVENDSNRIAGSGSLFCGQTEIAENDEIALLTVGSVEQTHLHGLPG